MKRLLLAMALLPVAVLGREATVASPNGELVVTVNDNGGQARYSVTLDGQEVLLPSRLGFKADFGAFDEGLRITDTRAQQIDRSYEMRQVKQSHIHYVATQLCVDFENAKGQKMTVELQVSDNNVALRYVVPRQKGDNPKSAVILSELTGFRLPEGTTTYLSPQSDPMIGWERTKPSYEEEYVPGAPLTQRSKYGRGYTFPCLLKTKRTSRQQDIKTTKTSRHQDNNYIIDNGDIWVLISETGVSSAFCGSHLSDFVASPSLGGGQGEAPSLGGGQGEAGAAEAFILYPMPEENNGVGSSSPGIALPGETPWRTITVGKTLKPIVETTIAYDVVEPLYEPSEDYKSGRYTWSWLIWQDNSVCWDDQIQFIDLAAAMGYEFCLVDGFWDVQIGRDRMPALADYARQKGVSLLLWYNSNGFENDAPQTPRQCMNTAMARDREMAWLKKIGVKGIKVDFFGGDKQETMKLYEDILYDANRYGLQCIFHGCTLPRGWERMYPNYVSSEAVLASENVYFSDHHAREEAFQLTMHPFCRNAVGTMDWGGVMMNRYMSRDNRSRHQRQTTNVFEMASGITNQTAIQCVAMQPNNLQELSDVELGFLRRLPTTWDETRFIDGFPGRYVVLARRHGNDWYVAGLNALKEPLTLTLHLADFFASQSASVYLDSKEGTTVLTPLKLDKRGNAKLTIQPNGGLIVCPAP